MLASSAHDQQGHLLFGYLTMPALAGVVLHAIVAVMCSAAALATRRQASPGVQGRYWACIGLAVLLSGLWELLGTEQAIQAAVRDISRSGHWYEDRRDLQVGLVSTSMVAAIAAMLLLARRAYRLDRPLAFAVAASVALISLLVVRLLSLHMVDRFLYDPIGPVRMNWILELAFLATIGAAVLGRSPAPPRRSIRRRSPPSPPAS